MLESATGVDAAEARLRRATLKTRLRDEQAGLRLAYATSGNPLALLRGRSQAVDRLLGDMWRSAGIDEGLALVAVGGYGRGELYPASDVDILILVPSADDSATFAGVEGLIGQCWDVGLEIGHSVRSIEHCVEEAARDITVETTLLESRFLAGNRSLYRQFSEALATVVKAETFFKAKRLEQEERYARYNDTPFSLEPNCKESPGGQRDLQTILWIAKASRLGTRWSDLAANQFVTAHELHQLARIETFLRHTRIRLHFLAGRREDRLLFDHQEAMAHAFGFVRTATHRASEQFMQRYFRNAKLVTQLNTILLQNIGVSIFPASRRTTIPINARFQMERELLDVRSEQVFEEHPPAILESFLLMQERSELKGMTARTLRALWRARRLITPAFRREAGNRAQFLKFFQARRGVVHELRRMNQYGILGRMIPAFGKVVGQMQHDLFHVYTVDQHILQVVRNVRRFTMAEHAHEYPFCSRLMAGFDRPWLLYVAAMFHDIAKGRGGDHSRLGMADARRFCRDHGIGGEDEDLVAFLVEHHLSMSAVAQKQDLTNSDVIHGFSAVVKTERRLVALYLLTVADIRGTSPKVWNAWKAKLLEDLFHATLARLTGGPATRTLDDSLEARRREAARQLRLYAVPEGAEQALWRKVDSVYFQRHTDDEIAWHARQLYFRVDGREPVVKARLSRAGAGLQVMIYLPDQKALFARICGFFGQARLSILDAKIHTTRHGYALDTFTVHDPANPDAAYRAAINYVEFELKRVLTEGAPLAPPPIGRLSRHLKAFPLTPEVSLFPDDKGTHYILEIVAGDRPGLLARIAYTLAAANVNVESARINTLGERAEDVFLIDGARLHDEAALLRLETALYEQVRLG